MCKYGVKRIGNSVNQSTLEYLSKADKEIENDNFFHVQISIPFFQLIDPNLTPFAVQ